MTDQFTSLPLAALKDIVAHVEESISLIEKHKGRITASDIQVKSMLSAVRRQLVEHMKEREQDKPQR
jgi:hypothetical protein